MAQLTVISREQYAAKRWKRYSSYSFAGQDTVAPLVAREVARACMHLPIGFVKTNDGFQLVAVQGLQAGKNLMVGPDGRWVGGYVPATYRTYPFALAKTTDDRRVLCFREESGLINDVDGERFFEDDGSPTKTLKDVLSFLEQVTKNAQQTAKLCEMLADVGLIQPWSVKLRTANRERELEGLFRVDEAALNALPVEKLDALRKAGALPVAYCQLLSMQHLHRLGNLAKQQAASESLASTESGELDLEFLRDDGNIRFS